MRREAERTIIAIAILMGATLSGLLAGRQIGAAGLLSAGAIYGVIATLVWRGLSGHAPHSRFGAANMVTMLRAGLTCVLAGLALEVTFFGGSRVQAGFTAGALWALASLAAGLLLLDGFDGWIARRQCLTSAFGARFDMEVDALFILALSTLALASGRAPAGVLLAGFLRYVFVAAGQVWPSLAAPVPPKLWRKAICIFMAIALIAALLPAISSEISRFLLILGVIGICLSFAADTVWLLQRREQDEIAAGLTTRTLPETGVSE